MSTIATLVVALQGNTRGFVRSLDLAESRLAAFGRGSNSALTGLGISFVAASVVVAAMSFKMAVDFESAMAGVRKTVDATDEEFAELTDNIRQMARELPFSTTEIAGVAEAAGQLGVGIRDIEDFTAVMLDLGVSTNISARDAAIGLARFSNVMGTPLSEARMLGDIIVSLGNNFATTESEILGLANRLTGIGVVVGLTEADVLGLAAGMSALGIPSELGGTAMQKFAKTVAVAVSDAGEDLDTFAGVAGVSAKRFADEFGDEPAKAMLRFLAGLGQAKDKGADQIQILKALGLANERVIRVLLQMAAGYDQMAGAVHRANEPLLSSGDLAEEAGRRYDTMASKIKVAVNNVKDAAISFGASIAPAVIGALDSVGAWFEEHGPAMRETWTALVAGLQPVGALIMIAVGGFGLLSGVLAESHLLLPLLIAGIVALAVVLAPIILTIAKFAAIAAGVLILAKAFNELSKKLSGLNSEIKTIATLLLLVAFGPLIGLVLAAFFFWRDEMGRIFEWVSDKMAWLKDNWRGFLADMLRALDAYYDVVVETFQRLVNTIISVVNFLGNLSPIEIGEIPKFEAQFTLLDDAIASLEKGQEFVDALRAARAFYAESPGTGFSDEESFFAALPDETAPPNPFAGFDFGDFSFEAEEAADRLSDLERAIESFLEKRVESEFEAFLTGGSAAVERLRARNALLDLEFQRTIEAAQAFGLDVSFLHRDTFDKVIADMEEASKTAKLGDLLGFLIARRQGGLAGGEPFVLPNLGVSLDDPIAMAEAFADEILAAQEEGAVFSTLPSVVTNYDQSLHINQLVVEAGADPNDVTNAVVEGQNRRRFGDAGGTETKYPAWLTPEVPAGAF